MNNFNQPTDIRMEPPHVNCIPSYPPTVMPMPGPTKSCPLVGFGVVLLLFSLGSIGLSAWALSLENVPAFAYAGLACGGFFALTSILAMAGGCDVGQRSCVIITCMIFGILGIITAAVSIIINILAILKYDENCSACKLDIHVDLKLSGLSPDGFLKCSTTCYEAYLPIHIGLCILSVFETLFGLILSCSACCNVCSCCCCYKEPYKGGIIIQPAPITSFISNSAPYRRLEEHGSNYA